MNIFTTGDRVQDLIEWARKIGSLGCVLEGMSQAGEYDLAGWYGGDLGSIIKDYSMAIETVLSSAPYMDLLKVFGDYKSPMLAKVSTDFARIKKEEPSHYRSQKINETMSDIQKIKKAVSFIFDIEQELGAIQQTEDVLDHRCERTG